MNRLRNPATALALMYLAFLVVLTSTAGELPARVATHFNLAGNADGWMSRSTYLTFIAVFGLVFPLTMPLLVSALRWIPSSAFNLPNRDYWLAPERASETRAYLTRHAWWLSALQMALVIAMHLMTVEANRLHPPRLSSSSWLLLALFLAGMAVWTWRLVRHFARPGPPPSSRTDWGPAA